MQPSPLPIEWHLGKTADGAAYFVQFNTPQGVTILFFDTAGLTELRNALTQTLNGLVIPPSDEVIRQDWKRTGPGPDGA